MSSPFDTYRAFHYATKGGLLYRFVNRGKRDAFINESGAELANGDAVTTRKLLAERGNFYAGLPSAWSNVNPDMQVLDESNAWRVRRQGETAKVWKDRVAKRQEFVKN